MSSSDDENMFNRTPSQLDYIDADELPYIQSTPRASWGQKLLNRSMDILNISNVSTYSTNGNKTTGADVAALEEKIQMQHHEIHKCKTDLSAMKFQLTLFEEQNDNLQSELQKVNKKLRSEQLLNEQLQKEISELREIKEEVNNYKKKLEEMTKKNTAAEREQERLLLKIEQMEEQKEKFEAKYEELSKREQEAKKQIFDIKLEMEMKEINIADLVQVTEGLKNQLNENKDLIDFLRSENEQLTGQNLSLNKALKDKRLTRSLCTQSAYKTVLDCTDSSTTSNFDNYATPVVESNDNKLQVASGDSPGVSPIMGGSPATAPSLRKQVLTRVASTPHGTLRQRAQLSAKRKILPTDEAVPKENLSQCDSDDSYTRYLETVKSLNNQFTVMDSLQVEMSKVNEIRACNCYQIIEDRDSVIEGLQNNIDEINSKMEEINLSNQNLLDEISRVKKQYEEAHTKLSLLQEESEKLRWDNKTLQHDKTVLENDVNKLAGERAELESQLVGLQNERVLMLDELRKHELNLMEMKKDFALNVDKVADLEKRCGELSEAKLKFETMKATLTEKENLIEELNKTIKSTAEWKKMLQEQVEGEIIEKRVTIQTLNEENDELKKKMDALKAELQEVVTNKTELDSVNKLILETDNKIREHLQEKNDIVSNLQKMNDHLSVSLQYLETDVQEKIHEIELLRDDIREDIDIKNSLWHELKKLTTENKMLCEEQRVLKEQKNEYNQVLVDYNRCQTDIKELKERIEGCQKNIEQQELIVEQQEVLIKTLQSQVQADEEERRLMENDYKRKIEETELTVEKLKSLKQTLESRVNYEIEEKNKYKKNVEDIEFIVEKQDAVIKALETQIQEEDEQKSLMTSTVKELEKKIVALEASKLRSSELMMLTKKEMSDKCQEIVLLHKELDLIITKLFDIHQNDTTLTGNRTKDLDNLVNLQIQQQEQHRLMLENITTRLLQVQKTSIPLDGTPIEKMEKLVDLLIQQKYEPESRKPTFGKHVVTIERLQNRVTALEKKVDNEKTRCDKLAKEKDELRGLNKKLEVQLVELVGENDDLKKIHKRFEEQLHELGHFKEVAVQKRAELEKNVEKLSCELTESHDKIKQLKCMVDDSNRKLMESTRNIEQSVQEKAELKDNLEKLSCELTECHDKIIQLNCMVDDGNRKLDEYNRNIEHMIEEKYALMTSEDRLREQLEQKQEFINKLRMTERRQELDRASNRVFSILRRYAEDVIQQNEDYEQLFKQLQNEVFQTTCSDCEKDLQQFVQQIKATTFLLELTAMKFPKHMELAQTEMLEDKVDSRFSPPDSVSHNTLKKFTLRAPRLVVTRPDSPDSPSLELFAEKQLPKPSNTMDSPDSDGKKHHKFDDSFMTADGDSMKENEDDHLFSTVELEKPFPHITDTFLEQLGLHETSETKKLSREETEELFTTLVIQLSIDSNDWKERHQKQKEQLVQLQEKIFKLLKEVSFRLRDHRCSGAMDSVKPVYIILEQAKLAVEKAIAAAAQYGVVNYEGRMMKCWNLVTNYTAMLRRDVVSTTSPSTKDSPSQTNMNQTRRHSKNTDSITDTLSAPVPISRIRRCALLTMSFVTTFAILLFLLSFVHLQCRMVSPEEQPCPLDFLMQKTINGPPPF